jgi:hypothetical protein
LFVPRMSTIEALGSLGRRRASDARTMPGFHWTRSTQVKIPLPGM